jgi:hypothetical protein
MCTNRRSSRLTWARQSNRHGAPGPVGREVGPIRREVSSLSLDPMASISPPVVLKLVTLPNLRPRTRGVPDKPERLEDSMPTKRGPIKTGTDRIPATNGRKLCNSRFNWLERSLPADGSAVGVASSGFRGGVSYGQKKPRRCLSTDGRLRRIRSGRRGPCRQAKEKARRGTPGLGGSHWDGQIAQGKVRGREVRKL